MRRIAGRLLAFVLITVAAVPVQTATAQAVGSGVGQRAPAVTLRTLDGKVVDLGAQIGRTPMLIQFFAAWCSQCRDQMPSFKRAIERYGKRVKFVGVAVSANQSPERARRYVQAHRLTHEILYDARGDAVARYDVPTTSYVVVINRRGRIVFTGSGGDLDVVAAAAKAL
jgi:peroxiredoxin